MIKQKNSAETQSNLIGNITLSLERLEAILFFLETHQEEQHSYCIEHPDLPPDFEPRVLSMLYMASDLRRSLEADFRELRKG